MMSAHGSRVDPSVDRRSVEITLFAPEHLALLRRFWQRVSNRPDDDAFARWRYLECPRQKTWVALDDGACVATISALSKEYRAGATEIECLELFDWACLPDIRTAGLGVRLLQVVRREGRATLSVGGSSDTLRVAPLLGSQRGVVHVFILPLRGMVEDALERRFAIPRRVAGALAAAPGPWFGAASHSPPRGERAVPVGAVGDELRALYRSSNEDGLVPVGEPAYLAWLTHGYPFAGHFIPLYFVRGTALVGWSLSRVYASDRGIEATLVDLFAPHATRRLYAWMVSESVARMMPFRPRSIEARASCPVLAAALRDNRFSPRRALPVYVWPHDAFPSGPIHLTRTVGDAATWPYRSRHW
jgi:hypothetical protein